MQKITPFLWFNNNVEEAIAFYMSIFPNAEIRNVVRNTSSTPGPEGSVMLATFLLQGQEFIGLNGGPQFQFTEAISFVVNCDSQQEVDMLWNKLSEGGKTKSCGWLEDKFGLSWQVVPTVLSKLMSSGDPEKSNRVMQVLMKMNKIEISLLEEAYEGKAQPV